MEVWACQVIGLGIIGKMKKVFQLLTDKDWGPCVEYLLNLRGKAKLTVTIQKYRKRRSTTANAYYWSVIIPTLAEHFGYRANDMHTAILGTYVGWEKRQFRNHAIFTPRRTSTTPDTMDTMDFSGLIQTGQQIAAEEGLILGDINDDQIA